MRELSELKINEGGKPVQRKAPSVGIQREFERRYGLSLPKVYLRLLEHANGGHPEVDSIVGKHGRWAVNRFYHLSDDRTSDASLWKAADRWRPVLGSASMPFANDGGGNQFYLDLSCDPPAVRLCIHDENFRTVEVAPSFEAFIDGLETDPDFI